MKNNDSVKILRLFQKKSEEKRLGWQLNRICSSYKCYLNNVYVLWTYSFFFLKFDVRRKEKVEKSNEA